MTHIFPDPVFIRSMNQKDRAWSGYLHRRPSSPRGPPGTAALQRARRETQSTGCPIWMVARRDASHRCTLNEGEEGSPGSLQCPLKRGSLSRTSSKRGDTFKRLKKAIALSPWKAATQRARGMHCRMSDTMAGARVSPPAATALEGDAIRT